MTSIRAAGYTSSGRVGTSAGLPGGMSQMGPAPPLEVKTSNTPEDVARSSCVSCVYARARVYVRVSLHPAAHQVFVYPVGRNVPR
jgi:hypothetical protein